MCKLRDCHLAHIPAREITDASKNHTFVRLAKAAGMTTIRAQPIVICFRHRLRPVVPRRGTIAVIEDRTTNVSSI
jgi:hypothetical protein